MFFIKNEMRLGTSSSQVAINLYMHFGSATILKMKKCFFYFFWVLLNRYDKLENIRGVRNESKEEEK